MANRSQDERPVKREVGELATSPEGVASIAAFVGVWRRTSTEDCSQAYPERIEFRADGVYLAASDDDVFREWQAGDFDVVAPEIVKLQMSNDAMVPYNFAFIDQDHLRFEDQSSCRIEYERVGHAERD